MKEVEPISGLVDATAQPDAEAGVEGEEDPFNNINAPGLSLIVLMRIYDVLIATYREIDPEKADHLVALHAEGKILGPLPSIDLE